MTFLCPKYLKTLKTAFNFANFKIKTFLRVNSQRILKTDMATRLYKIGSVFSRINGLIQKGVIDKKNPPVWFDIYYHFPPDYAPIYKRPVPEIEIPEILYEEDIIRAKLHKKLHNKLGVVDLNSKYPSKCQNWIKFYKECTEVLGKTESEAIEEIIKKEESNIKTLNVSKSEREAVVEDIKKE